MEKKLDKIMVMALAAGLGAGLAYLLDPQNGRRRRAKLRDRGFHMVRKMGRAARKEATHLGGRSLGLLPRIRQSLKARITGMEKVDDATLRDKVRSRIGHRLSHAHSLRVEIRDGIVTLLGPIPSGEIAGLLHEVRRIPGVRGVASPIPAR